MENLFTSLPMVAKMATNDYVGFTFFVGCMAMMAASVFFFFERGIGSNRLLMSRKDVARSKTVVIADNPLPRFFFATDEDIVFS